MKFIHGTKRDILILGFSALVSCTLFIGYSVLESGIGFPLDDAWIHQTFARNLAQLGEWSFIAGETSGASTGPLWGMMLSLIYLLGFHPVWGTYFLGYLIVFALGIGGFNLGKRLFPNSRTIPLLFGVMLTLEWHLVWASLSGMETMVLSLLSLALICWLIDKRENWWAPGLIVGLTIWIRPDGLTLIGPVLFSLIFRAYQTRKFTWNLVGIFGGLLFVVLPYFLFNYVVAGDIWPNTFYAKQAEYAFLREIGIFERFGTVSYQVLVGIGITLQPGLVAEIRDFTRSKDFERMGAFLWAFGYIVIYAWRLPVSYQHGRYIMPVMPVLFLLGLAGLARLIKLESPVLWRRVVSRSWAAVSVLTLVVFWILGARSFALDVGVINTEMVEAARWINLNTAEDSIIAAHDIGAIGYYGNRQIRDLAGLISPDVIPFLWDDYQLARYMDAEGVDYIYSFSDWYPGIIGNLEIAYQSKGTYAEQFGMESTAIYYWEIGSE